MLPIVLPGVTDLLGGLVNSATGSVFAGITSWMARGWPILIQWIWTTLDTATTPGLTEPWFERGLLGPIGLVALAVTIAMMLASAIQAALAGRPEQILDAFKHGAWSIVATAVTVTSSRSCSAWSTRCRPACGPAPEVTCSTCWTG